MKPVFTISQLYSSLESMEASLGGGGGFEGFYGSVTAGGVSKVYAAMQEHCNFDKTSFLVDIGGGLGRPLMHALVDPGVQSAIGIEVDDIKCLKSESVIREACKKMCSHGLSVPQAPRVLHRDIEQVNKGGTLDPATHAYTFWEGVPAKARMAFGQLFAKSSTLTSVAVVQHAVRKMTPEALMQGYGFGDLKLVATVKNVHMSGSQRSFTAYVFHRTAAFGNPFDGPSDRLLSSYLSGPHLTQLTLPRMLRSQRNAALSKDKDTQHNSPEHRSLIESNASEKHDDEPVLRSTSDQAALHVPTYEAEQAASEKEELSKIGNGKSNSKEREACQRPVAQLVSGKLRSRTGGPDKRAPAIRSFGINHVCRDAEHSATEAKASMSSSPIKRRGNATAGPKLVGPKKTRAACESVER